jgi:hypothetical protein
MLVPEQRMREIPKDPILNERVFAWSAGFSSPVTDPISKADYREVPLYLKLKAPSGAQIPGVPPPTDPSGEPQAPLPGTLPACRSEIEAADRRLAEIRTVIERDEPTEQIYFRSSPNPKLTADFQAVVERALPAAGPQVACRASVCRVELPGRKTKDPNDPWVSTLERDPEVRRTIGRKVFFPTFMLYEVGAGARPPAVPPVRPLHSGDGALKGVGQTFKAMLDAVDVAGCAKRFPATGTMQIELAFYPVGIDRSGKLDRFELEIQGELGQTPLGRCLREAVAREARKAPFPPEFRGTVRKKLEFPLAPR